MDLILHIEVNRWIWLIIANFKIIPVTLDFYLQSSQSGGKSSDSNVQRNKILKEVMVIPGVVQAMDMFDKEIALLAKKTNVSND